LQTLAAAVLTILLSLASAPVWAQESGPATPELRQRASVTAVDGVVLYKPGQLLVGHPSLQGRPAVRPLEGDSLATVPEQLDDYEVLSDGCLDEQGQPHQPAVISREVLARGDLGGDGRLEQVRVERKAPMAAPDVIVTRDGDEVGHGVLPVPAVPCRGLVAEAEPDGVPVLMVVWTSRGASSITVGVTVFELDEALPVAY